MDNYLYKDFFKLSINFGEKCNFNCGYCHNNKNLQVLNYDLVKLFIKEIEKKLNNFKNKNISILGGEPFLNVNIEQILYDFPNWEISIWTNGSMSYNILNKLIKYKNIFLIISLHIHQIKNIDEYIDKIIWLKNNFIPMKILILLEKNQKDKIFYLIKRFLKEKIDFKFKIIYPIEKYTDIKLYNLFLYKYPKNFLNNFIIIDNKIINFNNILQNEYYVKNLLCLAGRNNLFINNDGNIYLCESYKIIYGSKKSIGNIYYNYKNLIKKLPLSLGIICPMNICYCDKWIPKFTSYKEFKKFLDK